MKILHLLENKDRGWNNDSCDVWINPNGIIYDLGTESCHLQYIKENISEIKDANDLINEGWVKITNTKKKVTIEALSNVLSEHKNLIIPVLLEKAKTQEFELKISYINCNQLELNIPKDILKIVTLF